MEDMRHVFFVVALFACIALLSVIWAAAIHLLSFG
jgi:hypothetical protein